MRSFSKCPSLVPLLPVVSGICLGFTLNMMLAPFFDEICDPRDYTKSQRVNVRENNPLEKISDTAANSVSNKTPAPPKIPEIPIPIQQNVNNDGKRFIRPRYASTELGIREKLFVGVLTSPNSFNSYALAVNKTSAHYVTKMMFFSTSKPSNPSPGMPFVSFPDKNNKNLPIHVLKYISEHYAQTFDYYMFITDRTYIRAEKIFELVSHISISQDIHIGAPNMAEDSNICSLEGGIILSQSILRQVIAELDWCLMNTHDKHSLTLGRCIFHASLLPCSNIGADREFRHYQLNDFDFDDDIPELRNDPKFNTSLSVYPMPDDLSHYKVHRYFCQLELNLTKQEIDKAKDSIIHLSQYTPEGSNSLVWPIGSQEDTRPKTRFDVIRWDYFTESHIYFDDDFTNIRPLKGVHKLDIEEILEHTFSQANQLYDQRFSSYQLVNGYRKFEPSRGMEYVIDLDLKDKKGNTEAHRFHLLRPLGRIEMVPMPYVTETTKVTLVLPLFAKDMEEFGKFFHEFDVSILQAADESFLYVLMIYIGTSSKDQFAPAKATMDYYAKLEKGNGARMTYKVWQSSTIPTEVEILDHIMRDFKSDSLIAMITPEAQIDVDYLNRIRLNTIRGNQVFFPITFRQYKPNLAYDRGDIPSTVELNGKYGHFDVLSHEHFSFYVADYLNARKLISSQDTKKYNVFHIFIKYKKLQIFRAAEPSLRLRWKNITCENVHASDLETCEKRSAESLASRSQLAKLLFQYNEEQGDLKDLQGDGQSPDFQGEPNNDLQAEEQNREQQGKEQNKLNIAEVDHEQNKPNLPEAKKIDNHFDKNEDNMRGNSQVEIEE